ncbi:hypothetical protein Bca101_043754 [Brassica carinata]
MLPTLARTMDFTDPMSPWISQWPACLELNQDPSAASLQGTPHSGGAQKTLVPKLTCGDLGSLPLLDQRASSSSEEPPGSGSPPRDPLQQGSIRTGKERGSAFANHQNSVGEDIYLVRKERMGIRRKQRKRGEVPSRVSSRSDEHLRPKEAPPEREGSKSPREINIRCS